MIKAGSGKKQKAVPGLTLKKDKGKRMRDEPVARDPWSPRLGNSRLLPKDKSKR
jgi:hypothetical protein